MSDPQKAKPSPFKMSFPDFSNPLKDPVPPQFRQSPQNQQNEQQEKQPESEKGQVKLKRVNKTHSKFYIPGKTPGQPHKENHFRYCYNITKRIGTKKTHVGDKFDYFLFQADKKINEFQPLVRQQNPYNPFGLAAEFQVNALEDDQFDGMKAMLKKNYNVGVDDIIAIEGCVNDDKTILGGRSEFLSHFCTFFNFNICYSHKENKAVKKLNLTMSDNDAFNKRIDEFIRKFDEIK